MMQSEEPDVLFFEDDGTIPNSKYPVLLYENAFEERGEDAAAWLEKTFLANNWSNSWRDGVYPYHHYHSNTHEVLGIYSGSAALQLGGEHGRQLDVHPGDIIVIPAGVGHKNLGATENFGVVGAYPNGSDYDTNTGKEGERPLADKNIAKVLIPLDDPFVGRKDGVPKIWGEVEKVKKP